MILAFTRSMLLAVFSAVTIYAQTDVPVAAARFEKGDPFKIDKGRSFTASARSVETHRSVAWASGPRQISADLSEALDLIRERHVAGRSANTAEIARSAISSMLRALDPHSNYYDAAEYRQLLDEQRSEYSGVGTTIVNYKRRGSLETYIIATNPRGSAAAAGLKFGDRIVAVNGESMSGLRSDAVRDKVRGLAGSNVSLTIERAADQRTGTLVLRRATLPQPSLSDLYMVRPGLGFIDLTGGFTHTTAAELDAALRGLKAQGMTSLIIDLRGNPGGILDQAVKVAEKFLPFGTVIVSQRGRFPIDNRVWRSLNRNPETMPLVLLVDKHSASASEIVAGAFQDHDRALIVGEKTFGKGLVQSVLDLPSGGGLTLTTARYYTPSGRSIQRDYTGTDTYDYFLGRTAPSAAVAMRSDHDRPLPSGNGIAPDEAVSAEILSSGQAEALDLLFHFSVDVAYGRTISRPVISPGRPDAQISLGEEIAAEFRQWCNHNEAGTKLRIDISDEFIRERIAYNLVAWKFGPAAAGRILTISDAQVAAAASALPRAAELARRPLMPENMNKKSPSGRIPDRLR